MPQVCAVTNCSSRRGRDKRSFFNLPAVVKHQGKQAEELSSTRRREWLAAIKKVDQDFSDYQLRNPGQICICSLHFQSGKPSTLFDHLNPDWKPTRHLDEKQKYPALAKKSASGKTDHPYSSLRLPEQLAKESTPNPLPATSTQGCGKTRYERAIDRSKRKRLHMQEKAEKAKRRKTFREHPSLEEDDKTKSTQTDLSGGDIMNWETQMNEMKEQIAILKQKILVAELNEACWTSTSAGRVTGLLRGHTGKVNCVQWMECPFAESKEQLVPTELVSGSQDGLLIVWREIDGQYQQYAKLTGHTAAVTAVDAVYFNDHRSLIVTASGDSTVKIWQRAKTNSEFTLQQSLSFGSGFALDVALYCLPETKVPLLILGGDDTKLHLYTETADQFVRCLSLTGHEDWIRGVQITADDTGDLLVASCSQDCFIRLWRIVSNASEPSDGQVAIGDDTDELRLKGNRFTVSWQGGEKVFSVVLESVLAGHEQWVYGLHWQPATYEDGRRHQETRLLSASMDKTMIIWKLDMESGVWLDHVRVGEVGGNTLGLYGCQFSPDGRAILAHGYQGAFHLWTKGDINPTTASDQWSPAPVVSGHYAGVQDIVWEPESGEFLMSVGLDQTTRLHAPWRRNGYKTTWHEIARPQVHGYDMQCLTLVNRYRLASAADEKVLRVFDGPRNFIENFGRILGVDVSKALEDRKQSGVPEGASVPALGLSNKAVFQGDSAMPNNDRIISNPSEMYPEIYFSPLDLAAPPTEEHLLQNTLWPESQKLYGHSYEIFSIASHPAGTLIASACKASKPEYATIILWDATSWRQLGQLASHSLTVTQLAFSHDGARLLAVSRDRTWSVFEVAATESGGPHQQDKNNGCPYALVACTDKKTSVHTRIIWSCAWSHDDRYFATGSRDKKVIVWGRRSTSGQEVDPGCLGDYRACSVPVDMKDAVTAVDFAPVPGCQDRSYIIAVGMDSGSMAVLKWSSEKPNDWQTCFHFEPQFCHTMTVKRLRWRPKLTDDPGVKGEGSHLQLASCSSDGSVRIHNVGLSSL